jgi:nucleoid DNA-binding protein
MNQRELIQAMVRLGETRAAAEDRYRETFGALGSALARASVADVAGVGTFSAKVTTTEAVDGMNPFTRQPYSFPARRRVRIRFDPDAALLEAINLVPDPAAGAESRGRSDPLFLAFVSALTGPRPGEVRLAGIGTFRVWKMPAQRALVNSRTVAVTPAAPAYRTVRFVPGSKLKAESLPETGDESDDGDD